ncbi:chemotaxis protein CheD [Halobellus captivus]|uniref:chemotaxis protein CheD n=1 Tax=Halobellus captivus TaxID=2592614 RepID=UPI00119DF1C6|nr:chemotaxis protein CheD [Halobellus captivus]
MKVYTSDPTDRSTGRVKVGVADYAVAEAGATLVTSGLGSCVGIALVDVDAGVGGLAHAMLPEDTSDEAVADTSDEAVADTSDETVADTNDEGIDADGRPSAAKYVDSAVPALVEEMVAAGADPGRIEARLAGGSAMFEFTSRAGAIGERNAAAARETLEAHAIPLVASDVGGDYGRSLTFDVGGAELSIRRAHGEIHTI